MRVWFSASLGFLDSTIVHAPLLKLKIIILHFRHLKDTKLKVLCCNLLECLLKNWLFVNVVWPDYSPIQYFILGLIVNFQYRVELLALPFMYHLHNKLISCSHMLSAHKYSCRHMETVIYRYNLQAPEWITIKRSASQTRCSVQFTFSNIKLNIS